MSINRTRTRRMVPRERFREDEIDRLAQELGGPGAEWTGQTHLRPPVTSGYEDGSDTIHRGVQQAQRPTGSPMCDNS